MALSPSPGGGNTRRNLGIGCLAVVVLLVVGALAGGSRPSASGGAAPTATPAAAKQLVGTFVKWVPVDEENGYAYIEITNNGATRATAECTVSVSNDFGNFGFDSLVGQTIGPGETFSGRMAINVSKGSYLIDKGEVTDC